jgi:hypothetical protein
MKESQRALITLKALFGGSENDTLNKEYVLEKLDACLELAIPEVLLDEEGKKRFDDISEDLARRGKIHFKKK